MYKPLVSVIIPAYNRGHIIHETLDSVLAQTYSNWECIIVDDGSTDNVFEVVNTYCISDKRFQFYNRPESKNKSANSCRNYGIEKSQGSYIQFLDSDDIISMNKLENQLDSIGNYNKKTVVTCRWGFFSNSIEDAKLRDLEPYYKNFKIGLHLLNKLGKNNGYLPSHAYLFSKTILEASGMWNEEIKINQDGDFFCRVLLSCDNIVFAEDAIAYYRMGNGDNISTTQSKEKMLLRIESWKSIEIILIEKYGNKKFQYIKNAKKNLFAFCKLNLPDLIEENNDFFKNQKRLDKMISNLRYLKRLFK